MLLFLYKIKISFFNALKNVIFILLKIKQVFKLVFLNFFYYKIILRYIFLPFYSIYKRLIRDIVAENGLKLGMFGRLMAVVLNKKSISFLIVCFALFIFFIDNFSVYGTFNKELKLGDTIFFYLLGAENSADSVIVDNTGAIKIKDNSYISTEDINHQPITKFIPADPEDITFFVFDYTSVYKPNIINIDEQIAGPSDNTIGNYSKFVYVVKSGDSISSIASKFNINIDTILWENKLTERSVLRVGKKIYILPFTGVSHKVEYGDTLIDIGNKYGVNIDLIKQYNLIRGDVVRLGQNLVIPTTKIPKYRETSSVASNTSKGSLYPKVAQVTGDGKLKAHAFPYGQCTWYVATRRFIPWAGHAKDWLKNSKKYGYKIGDEPTVGAIVATKESSYGHVAYVEEVTEDSIVISEMNYKGLGILNKRVLDRNDWRILGYIY